ncbi:MAG: acetyl-CoA carboxylase carboxyltransferase subunit alpha [Thermoguttaceae bacterium]|nr:acetyl-CoA carboxylase carboxyltransferase subunit alpha [Thermoguttaceae bacterium]MBQ9455640.1 acetyl-CoA carboxylase carboxyltransferase subunit alpha [Thermoguttaceae bacterium]
MEMDIQLSFEQPIYELESRLEEMEQNAGDSPDVKDSIKRLRKELVDLKRSIYQNLQPWETVEVSRHPNRPQTSDYLNLAFDEFVELHGDRFFGDDPAIITGWAKLDGIPCMVVGHQKGKNLNERTKCRYGCAEPEGYRKALQKMQMAAKYHLPIISLIDTPGAWPGVEAEERGQAWVIAEGMFEMSRLHTPIICVVIGEGGSGGAIGIGVGDRVAILEHAYYSVISPEGCAGILWKSKEYRVQAAEQLHLTSKDLKELGIVDAVIPEPLGGAHRDPRLMAGNLKKYLRTSLRELAKKPIEELLEKRYEKFRKIGVFIE